MKFVKPSKKKKRKKESAPIPDGHGCSKSLHNTKCEQKKHRKIE